MAYFCNEIQNLRNIKQTQALIFWIWRILVDIFLLFSCVFQLIAFVDIFRFASLFCSFLMNPQTFEIQVFFLYFSRFYRCGWVWMGFWWKNEFFCHFFCVFGHFFVDFRRTTCLHLIAFWSALICLIFPRVPTFLWLCSKSVKLSWNDFFKRLFVAFLSFYNLQNSTLRVVLSRRREKLWVY